MVIVLPKEIERIFTRRRFQSREVSDVVLGEKIGSKIYCVFSAPVAKGDSVSIGEEDYNPEIIRALEKIAGKYPKTHIIYHHIHPIEGLSFTDRDTLKELGREYGIRYALVTTPTNINAYYTDEKGIRDEYLERVSLNELPEKLSQLLCQLNYAYAQELLKVAEVEAKPEKPQKKTFVGSIVKWFFG